MSALYWIPENLNKIINFDDIDNIDYNIFKLKYEDDKDDKDKKYNNDKNDKEQYYRDIIQNSNNEKTLLIINFINGKYIKFTINTNEKLINIKIWLLNMIEYYSYKNERNEYFYPIFLHKDKILNNISLTVSDINNEISCIIITKYHSMHCLKCTNSSHMHNLNLSIEFSSSCLGEECLYYTDEDDDVSGILLPRNINIYEFPDEIPDQYIDEYTDIQWYELKIKIDNIVKHRIELEKKESFSKIMYKIQDKEDDYRHLYEDLNDFLDDLSCEEKEIYINYCLVRLDN